MRLKVLFATLLATMTILTLVACGSPAPAPTVTVTAPPITVTKTVTSTPQAAHTTTPTPTPTPTPSDQRANILELQSWSWRHEYDFAIAEGQVKNISSKNLDNVQVVITWYTTNHTFITSETALIEYNPILPGQTSPFKLIAIDNPSMDIAGIDFKFLMGQAISWRKATTP